MGIACSFRHKRLKRFSWCGFSGEGDTHSGWELTVVAHGESRQSRGRGLLPRVVSLGEGAVWGSRCGDEPAGCFIMSSQHRILRGRRIG